MYQITIEFTCAVDVVCLPRLI